MHSAAGNERTTAAYPISWVLFLIAASVNGLLLWHFHDRYWYPSDDGFYANIAERLLSGDVLNLNVQDVHPGYIHFLHTAAFRIFGPDMVSLRYPLMLAAFVQACLVYVLLQRRNVLLAAVGSIAMTALGVIQFVDPTPNWYCLSFCVALACWLTWLPLGHRARLVGAGVLLGVLTLFRQLSGVWVGMALIVVILLERTESDRERGGWLARAVLLIMLTALVGYLILSPETEPGGVVLIAIWPIAILVWTLVNVRTGNAVTTSVLAQLALGAALPALPLVAYHIAHGSVGVWLADTVLSASGLTQLPFFGHGWYGVLPLAGLYQAVTSADSVKIANGLYWVALPIVSVVNGLMILSRLRRNHYAEGMALPVLATFYALVSLFFEGPLYLYYSVGLSLVAALWLGATGSPLRRTAMATAVAGLSLVAVIFHAGQSRLRTPREILEGQRITDTWNAAPGGLPRCSLRLEQADREAYGRMVSLIQTQSQSDESIFALPNDAELYFLANRRNPFRFYNSALGIRTADALRDVLQKLAASPPRLVMFRPDDKYNTDASRQIMELVRARYTLTDTIGGLETYTLR